MVQRALILKAGNLIEDKDIQFEEISHNTQNIRCGNVRQIDEAVSEQQPGLNGDLRAREQDLIISALHAKNNRKEVAEKLGISPRTLRYKLARMRDAGVAIPA